MLEKATGILFQVGRVTFCIVTICMLVMNTADVSYGVSLSSDRLMLSFSKLQSFSLILMALKFIL